MKQISFLATTTAAAVGQTANLSGFRMATLIIAGLATETIAVAAKIGAGTGTGPPAVVAAGTFSASAALANGTYYFRDLAVDALIFTKSGATDNVTVRFLAT